MATTSFLYHAQGVRGYRHLRTEYVGGTDYHHVELQWSNRRCRGCGARCSELTLAGRFTRTFRALPVGRRRQKIVLHGHKQDCRSCGRALREPVLFTEGEEGFTKAFRRYVHELCSMMTINDVARLLQVGWDLVKGIHKEHLAHRLRRRKLGRVRTIAVDEFATHKGHTYMTVALDLESGEILHAHEGKDAQALIPFLRRLKRARAPLEAVAIDMSEAYQNAVREVFGDRVDIVFDRFHVVSRVNDAIDETRRSIVRTLEGEERKAVKGLRYVLLKASEKLDSKGLERLEQLAAVNSPLYYAHLLKEQLRELWNHRSADEANVFLDEWLEAVRGLGNTAFARLADTIERYRAGILAWFRHRITTGPLEGLNNKIKVLKRQAYGFRDMVYFKLRICFLHEATYRLSG